MEMTPEQEKFFDLITGAGMSLADLRAYKKDLALGDTITPSEWMKAKELPASEREQARNARIEKVKNAPDPGLETYLKDKFDPTQKEV
jgi:hypothetical protein